MAQFFGKVLDNCSQTLIDEFEKAICDIESSENLDSNIESMFHWSARHGAVKVLSEMCACYVINWKGIVTGCNVRDDVDTFKTIYTTFGNSNPISNLQELCELATSPKLAEYMTQIMVVQS